MKKHFLLVIFLTVMFLWLGNYSLGQFSSCWQEPNPSVASQTDIDAYNACIQAETSTTIPTTSTQTDADCLSTCLADPALAGMEPTLKQDKCNQKCTATTSTVWTPCPAGKTPIWWTINSFWICSCPTGTKNVKGTCTSCQAEWVCCWVELNTSIPFIGKCIESDKAYKSSDETSVTWETAFPVLMWSMAKILVTVILIVSFVLIVIWGIMISTGDPAWGKKMIIKVVVGIALLGASGVILRLINPNFFG